MRTAPAGPGAGRPDAACVTSTVRDPANTNVVRKDPVVFAVAVTVTLACPVPLVGEKDTQPPVGPDDCAVLH